MVARDADEAAALERELGFRAQLGVPLTRLRPSEARRLEPALAPTLRLALEAPDDHVADPRLLAPALAEAARRAGAVLRTGAEVAAVRRGEVDLAGGETIRAGDVVVAAGAWAGELAGARVRPLKGQILRLRDPDGPGLLERVVRWEGGYLVPRGTGRYVLGATMEDKGFDTTVTAGGVWELLRDASELVPGVLELELEETFAGLRPTTPDNTPLIGRSERTGLVFATGHHRNGVLLASITGDLVADALDGAAPEDAPRAGSLRGAGGGRVITVNGTEARLPVGARIADVLDALGVEPGRRGVAIAIDGEVVPRTQWDTTSLTADARVEVVQAIQGG